MSVRYPFSDVRTDEVETTRVRRSTGGTDDDSVVDDVVDAAAAAATGYTLMRLLKSLLFWAILLGVLLLVVSGCSAYVLWNRPGTRVEVNPGGSTAPVVSAPPAQTGGSFTPKASGCNPEPDQRCVRFMSKTRGADVTIHTLNNQSISLDQGPTQDGFYVHEVRMPRSVTRLDVTYKGCQGEVTNFKSFKDEVRLPEAPCGQ